MPPGGAVVEHPSSPAERYCRDARRIRSREAGRPGRRYRELRALSARHDAAGTPRVYPPAAIPRAEKFAAEVKRELEGPVLRQSRRRALLMAARGMGIGRFEANLIIAAVQHHCMSGHPVGSKQAESGVTWARLAPFAVVLVVQAAIAWGAWRVLFG